MTGGPPASPGRLPLRDEDVRNAAPGFAPVPIEDGVYISFATPSMTDEPLWLRVAGHIPVT